MAFVLSDKFKALVNTPFLLLLCFFFTVHIRSPTTSVHVTRTQALPGCPGLHKLKDNHSECLYVNYLHLYYCLFGSHPPLACALLALWLLVLFYLLGNTASQYLCFSVENLSRVLNFSPVVAGATLLSLGNGSPDVLAGVVSFSFGSGELGLRSVLGGTFFVSCVVIGAINLGSPSSSRSVRIDKSTFVRDVCSFIVVLSSLLVILLVGRITIWGAMVFACLHLVYASLLLYLIDMPLDLPRMITIPDVSEQRWSGMYAVSSATLAPIFVTALCSSKRRGIGSHDAEELVGMLESLDYILAVNPAILGLTVLAWGNSIGDLMSNVAMAMSGGRDGAQVAISGCNAGPIFNTVAGLGLSHVVPAWALHPDSSVIPVGTAVLEILGFMSGGSLWALVTLARKDMKLERVVGVGMLLIDLCFLSLRLSQSLGLVA
ncbi:Sodium/calcium exchanger protein [Musa troglodytarum]|uniref:Sodium/calcium exchanger protein n=1 Tax=Musa troglodytarum TaxID=320322 RepID=A0A9E7HXX2_9LILI|nr:Sodium/calcium exchanger protein [Musa troglodytarum]